MKFLRLHFSHFFSTKKKVFFKSVKHDNKPEFLRIIKSILWFTLGAILGFFFFISFIYIFYQRSYKDLVYIGVYVDGQDFSGKTKNEVRKYFALKNRPIEKNIIEFKNSDSIATISARRIGFGLDEDLLAEQAFAIGRSDDPVSNASVIIQAYFNRINLPRSYHHEIDKLDDILLPVRKKLEIKPVNALFNFENGRVTAFTLSSNGQVVDMTKLKKQVYNQLVKASESNIPSKINIEIPIKVLKPEITNENVNDLGVQELIGVGTSLFYHSIENRIFNIKLAAGRLNGILIAPGEVFSFAKALGDVSGLTGYKQAYVIENGKTVLGDGGGVCQVSTTLFRAALAAGLPIVERNPHAYRVGYYEQDSGPGIDAAVYVPSVDLKFKNDTGHHILIQSYTDLENLKLTFDLYGTGDGREVTINKPVILSQSPAPEARYQDDPTLPKGIEKQIDFAAGGAKVFFTRTVKKNDKVIIEDKFNSNYRPWQAVFLRGTKE